MSTEATNSSIEFTIDTSTLVETHIDKLYKFAMIRVRDNSVAEDLVQETLLAAIETPSRFAAQSSVGTWLTGILKHKIIDHYRRQSYFVGSLESDDEMMFDGNGHWREDAAPLPWSSRTPEDDLENKQLAVLLKQALGALPRPLATVFALHEIEGLGRTEICELLGLSESNYWTMLHRARLRLRKEVEGRLHWTPARVGSILAPAIGPA